MQLKRTTTGLTAVCLLLSAGIGFAGQGGQRGGLAGARGGGAAGNAAAGPRPAPTNFPAQQRPAGDPAVVARGKSLYEINCRSCHGADLRGGEQGGPNLLRAQATLNDKAGELIYPIVREGRRNPGMPQMPSFPLPQDDVKAIAEYIHSVLATAQRQGGPPPGPRPVLNLLVGDATAGKTYFDAKCSSCHSVTGDLKGIGGRTTDVMQLQNNWLAGTSGGGRGGGNATPVTVTVTPPSGPKVEGRLNRIDDFIVIVNLEDGSSRSFRRDGDNPKVEVRDPRDPHRKLLPEYTDKDIHDVTAYLVTLK
jgi:cytochrome c oxidase cbb3-type subunit III